MSLQITKNDLSDLFNNTFIMSTMIKKAIDMVIENFQEWKEYSPFSDRPSYDEDYTVVNIYEINEKTLNLVCVNGSINVDYCYFTEIGNKKEKEFSVLATYKLTPGLFIVLMANGILSMLESVGVSAVY